MSTPRPRRLPVARPFESLVQALRDPHRILIDRLHERLDAAGYGDIRPAHGNVIGFLSPEGTRITELATRAQLTKQTIQYLVDDLEGLGYVERAVDPTDARARLVRFTSKGRGAVRAAESAFREIEREWSAGLGADKMNRLRGLLNELRAVIDP